MCLKLYGSVRYEHWMQLCPNMSVCYTLLHIISGVTGKMKWSLFRLHCPFGSTVWFQPAKPLPVNRLQRRIWVFLENPDSSLAARILAIISVSVIILSIATFCLETLPELKRYHPANVNLTGGKHISYSTIYLILIPFACKRYSLQCI